MIETGGHPRNYTKGHWGYDFNRAGLLEQITGFNPAFLRPIKVPVKTHDTEIVLFCYRILAGIIKIQAKLRGTMNNPVIIHWVQG